MAKEIIECVKSIADDLNNSDLVTCCRECNYNWAYDEEIVNCPDCDSSDIGEMTAHDYMSDVLDIEYTVNGGGEYLGARILVCFGGPNIWINTRTCMIEGYWWNDKHFESFNDEIGLDDYCQELWECR